MAHQDVCLDCAAVVHAPGTPSVHHADAHIQQMHQVLVAAGHHDAWFRDGLQGGDTSADGAFRVLVKTLWQAMGGAIPAGLGVLRAVRKVSSVIAGLATATATATRTQLSAMLQAVLEQHHHDHAVSSVQLQVAIAGAMAEVLGMGVVGSFSADVIGSALSAAAQSVVELVREDKQLASNAGRLARLVALAAVHMLQVLLTRSGSISITTTLMVAIGTLVSQLVSVWTNVSALELAMAALVTATTWMFPSPHASKIRGGGKKQKKKKKKKEQVLKINMTKRTPDGALLAVSTKGTKDVELLPAQQPGADKHLRNFQHRSFSIDVSDTGAGKTYISGYIRQQLGVPVFLIGPPNAAQVWHAFALEYKTDIVDYLSYNRLILENTDTQGALAKPRHTWLTRNDTIINIKEIMKNPSATRKYLTTFQPTERLTDLIKQGVLFVFDEAQSAKNNTSATSRAVAAIVHTVRQACKNNPHCKSRVLMLSATLADKHEQIRHYMRMFGMMKKAVNIAHDVQDALEYARNLFTSVQETMEDSDFEEKTRYLEEINTQNKSRGVKIAEKPSKKCKKELVDAAKADLYSIYTNIINPIVSSCSPKDMTGHKHDIANLFMTLPKSDQQQYENSIQQLTEAIELLKRQTGEGKKKSFLGAFNKAFQALCRAKVGSMAVYAKCILRSVKHSKVILMVEYLGLAAYLAKELQGFNPLVYTGKTPMSRRPDIIDKFQQDNDQHRLIIVNITSGSTAISLHDKHGGFPRYMLVLPTYRINEQQQALGRHYRTGMEGDAWTRMLYGKSEGTAQSEESLLKALKVKGGVLHDVAKAQVGTEFPDEFKRQEAEAEDFPFKPNKEDKTAITDVWTFLALYDLEQEEKKGKKGKKTKEHAASEEETDIVDLLSSSSDEDEAAAPIDWVERAIRIFAPELRSAAAPSPPAAPAVPAVPAAPIPARREDDVRSHVTPGGSPNIPPAPAQQPDVILLLDSDSDSDSS